MPIQLAIFDVDGTLLRGDTACQTVARGLGKYERMCEMERIKDVEQIVAAREEMAGWYIDAGLEGVKSHLSDLQWAPGVREGTAELKDAGIQLALASVTWSFAVEHVAEQLGISRFRSTELDFTTRNIRHAWGDTKSEYMHELAEALGIATTEIAAVGDSPGDYEMLRGAGLAIFVGNEPPDLTNVTHLPDADIRDVWKTILNFESRR